MKAMLFDYGAGNLHSLTRALTRVGLSVRAFTEPGTTLADAHLLVLPGVGAFGLAADRLERHQETLRRAVRDGLPVLGICLGLQLLFASSEEDAARPGRGLGLLSGTVTRLRTRRSPHIGWTRPEGFNQLMYFAHSYVCQPENAEVVRAWATHETARFPAVIRSGRVAGVQFHPEKSSSAGLELLDELVREVTR
jgi:glutamine amidotransferase